MEALKAEGIETLALDVLSETSIATAVSHVSQNIKEPWSRYSSKQRWCPVCHAHRRHQYRRGQEDLGPQRLLAHRRDAGIPAALAQGSRCQRQQHNRQPDFCRRELYDPPLERVQPVQGRARHAVGFHATRALPVRHQGSRPPDRSGATRFDQELAGHAAAVASGRHRSLRYPLCCYLGCVTGWSRSLVDWPAAVEKIVRK